MRRWITILLLIMLPLQFAFGAAAQYCQHEKVVGKPHIGHHEHVHNDALDGSAHGAGDHKGSAHADEKGGQSGGKLSVDLDCEYCHLSASNPMVACLPELQLVSEPVRATSVALHIETRGPDRHERPKWRIA